MTNPTLIEVTRGPLVESFHTGSVVLARADGDIVMALGDTKRDIFPRSSIKALQCIPLVETGAAEKFGFGDAEIALACASHTGTKRHTNLASDMLSTIGLDEGALGCGAHLPLSMAAVKELWSSGCAAGALHNNCSGKHAGMLATAKHCGEALSDYWEPAHPVQSRVRDIMSELSGLSLGDDVMGRDGCAVPNWAMPLEAMAGMFAKLVTGHGLSGARRKAVAQILSACWAEPDLIAGKGRADSVVMKALPGRIFLKTGAEGVYCGAFAELGLGFAIKIDDGVKRASAGTAIALVEAVLPEAKGLMQRGELKSWRGDVIGQIRTAPALGEALAKLKLPA